MINITTADLVSSVTLERIHEMRKAKAGLLERRLAETHLSEHERSRALNMMREAEAIADAIVWAKNRVASLGSLFLKPGFKN